MFSQSPSCRYLLSSFYLRVPAFCTGCLFRKGDEARPEPSVSL
ncbi:hypothetical protein OIU79_009491 [Salix purpurea]|uniref:Uncharacterized protein n=1 Tax=Salix purpurea TaxID=77065 RepID=A0A9Q0TKZ3_SALPP|nr:hypothetical protein OIU79_009491 [Salix purpurea]